MQQLTDFFSRYSVLSDFAPIISLIVLVCVIAGMAILANYLARKVIVGGISRFFKKTESKRDDILVQRKVFERLSQFAPALVIYTLVQWTMGTASAIATIGINLSLIYMIFVSVFFIDALINAGQEIYRTYPISRQFPIKSFVQVAKMILYFLGIVATLSLILGESPLTFLAGFGALTAVLMLVFKDPILGFVAGIQLSANRMVAVGDWIEMPKYGLDGDVMEIALTTVKVRNFDKTITTVPTQSLINDSFKNWRGMKETGGRRIKRALYLDVSSVRFCDEEMLKRFSKIQYIADYIDTKRQELTEYNQNAKTDHSTLINGRHLTNLGTFRAYVQAYLRNHPKISKTLTLLVRQLQPTEHGLPLEIYVFTSETDWLVYEGIQADIFDHIFAAVTEFDLKIFQNPTGSDFAQRL